jgi:hypothetical protein
MSERLRYVLFRPDGTIAVTHRHGAANAPCQCWLSAEPLAPGCVVVVLPGITAAADLDAWDAFTRSESLRSGWTPWQVADLFNGEVLRLPSPSRLAAPRPGMERRFLAGPRVLVDADPAGESGTVRVRDGGVEVRPRALDELVWIYAGSRVLESSTPEPVRGPGRRRVDLEGD